MFIYTTLSEAVCAELILRSVDLANRWSSLLHVQAGRHDQVCGRPIARPGLPMPAPPEFVEYPQVDLYWSSIFDCL
jgi:hypothetical protein